jgi:acetylornithine aminotransferase
MGETFDRLKAKDERHLIGAYGRYPVALSHGAGSRLYDVDGKEYVDLLAGIAVCALGHAHPAVADAVSEQMRRLVHTSNLFYTFEQADLAERLVSTWRPGAKAFFCNSGAEANEAAIKLARRYMQKIKHRDAHEIVTLEGSFHGRTLATLTATGQDHVKDGFDPLPPGFRTAPFGDLHALADTVGPQTAAVLIEVVQGEYGVRLMSAEYARGVEALCRERGVLLMVDEVQTGMCRTGSFWAHSQFGITPDVITAAKPLAGGLPMGALLASEEASKGFAPGSHATTFGGGPVLCRAALAVLDVMLRENLAERASEVGAYAADLLTELAGRRPERIAEVRGLGLMIGVELKESGKDVWRRLLDEGYILNLTKDRILRLVPPLVIEKKDIEDFVRALEKAL